MSANVVNQMPYLRTSREFPTDTGDLSVILNKSYIDTANAVNGRIIGTFPTTRPAITGEAWFFGGKKYQGLRQVYQLSSTDTTIPHNIDLNTIRGFTKIYGTFTDGTDWYPLPYVDETAVTDQIALVVDASNIQINKGGGGGQPTVQEGFIVLEWISQTSTNIQV